KKTRGRNACEHRYWDKKSLAGNCARQKRRRALHGGRGKVEAVAIVVERRQREHRRARRRNRPAPGPFRREDHPAGKWENRQRRRVERHVRDEMLADEKVLMAEQRIVISKWTAGSREIIDAQHCNRRERSRN